jgi:hypothetical protein
MAAVVERYCLHGQTVIVAAVSETYLRLMAQNVAEARPPWRLPIRATAMQAVAHAFVLLGLISPEAADAAITQASRTIGPRGVGGSGPAVSATTRDYRTMRDQGPHALAWTPRAVAVGASQLPLAAVDLSCDWFRTARAGVRFQIQGATVAHQPPSRSSGIDLAELSATDDAGRSYRLRWDGIRGSSRLWMGEIVAEPIPEQGRDDDVAWFELAAVSGPTRRVIFVTSPAVPVGPAAPPWPTPAESYLAWLGRQDPAPELSRGGGREVLAAVAEASSLIAHVETV